MHGHKCFLWTCREGKYLEDAKNFLESKGLYLDGYNVSPLDHVNNGRKPIADIYIDDHNMFNKCVDWKRIENYILYGSMNDTEKIERLREQFKRNVSVLCRKVFYNKKYGMKFVFNKLSVNKLGCLKSINTSIKNGFTVEKHFEVAARIKDLFERSDIIAQEFEDSRHKRVKTTHVCVTKVDDDMYACMYLVIDGKTKDEGYIDLYLSKAGGLCRK